MTTCGDRAATTTIGAIDMSKGLTLKNNTPRHFYFCDTPMLMRVDGILAADSGYVLPVFRRKADAMSFAFASTATAGGALGG